MGCFGLCCNPELASFDQPINIDKFMGDWYVIGVIPTPFEKNAYNPIEKYEWNAKTKEIDVNFVFNQGALDGPEKTITQGIEVTGYPEAPNGVWKAKPYHSFIGLGYVVMDLADDYSWTVVGHPSRKWFWIMARETSLDEETLANAVELGRVNGFDMSKMIKPKHNDTAQI